MSKHHGLKISVIIPCKGHSSELRNCINGLCQIKIDIPYEVIVVDSNADSEVLSTVQDFSDIKIVRSNENLNAGPARNLGVSHASGCYLAFIDADCIPTNRWLKAAYDALENGAQMVGGPVLDEMPYHPIAATDNLLQFAELGSERPFGITELLPGCNLAVRKDIFKEVNGFPDTPLIEDSLFTATVNFRWPNHCYYVPEMQVTHKGRTTLKELWRHQYIFGYVRGIYGFRVKEYQQKLARKWIITPLVILKRMVYIFSKARFWKFKLLLRNILLLPFIVVGLLGWTSGFREGCQDTIKS
jgi:glycosyltransferase involved in cell wall biosynthesis